MPIRRSPNGAHHPRPQPGRDRPEQVVAITRWAHKPHNITNQTSQSLPQMTALAVPNSLTTDM